MELRVYRTFRWVLAVPDSEIRYGGENPMRLKASDELQYRSADGAWLPIPVVEEPRPEHPRVEREREHDARMVEAMTEAMKNAKCHYCGRRVGISKRHRCAAMKKRLADTSPGVVTEKTSRE